MDTPAHRDAVWECLNCASPQAADVKHALGQGALAEPGNWSPGGRPLLCCHVKFAGAVPTSSVTSAIDQPAPYGRR
jgi:hypothetical protein